DDVRLPLLPQRHEELEDVLPPLREGANVEVVHRERLGRDPELGGRLAHLACERVGREAGRQRAGCDREGHVANVAARLDEPRHGPPAPELAVVGVRREDERRLPALDHRAIISGTGSSAVPTGSGRGARTRLGAASATSPINPHVVGSSKTAWYASEGTKIATSPSPADSAIIPNTGWLIRRYAARSSATSSEKEITSQRAACSAANVTGA